MLVAELVMRKYREIDDRIGEDDIIDISVSFNGSWQKRGHTSLYGVGTVIDLETGLILDYQAYSQYRHVCSFYL